MLNLIEYQWISAALGWTLIHSIWQIALVGVAWFFINASTRKIASSTKYFISILAMIITVLISVVTLFSEMKSRYPDDSQVSEAISTQVIQPIIGELPMESAQDGVIPVVDNLAVSPISKLQSTEWLSPVVLKIVVLFWLFGVLFFGIRFIIQWRGIQKLATKGISPFEQVQLKVFNKLKNKIGIKKRITFLLSTLAEAPLTFGHFKPIILLPLGMINGFPPTQIEAIILHELAHIKRNDFLINVIQTWLEILFFYHPVVWVISKKIRTIREELCDDEVLRVLSYKSDSTNITDESLSTAKICYAESLLNLQKYFLHNKNQLAMNANSNKSELSDRIHRLFQSNQTLTKEKRNINAYLFGLVILITVVSVAFSKITYPTVSIAVDKMNVLYVGIDNPITVAVAGIPTEETKVESEQLKLEDQGNGHYIAKAGTPGKAIIKVTAEGHATKEIEFRVKRIPDPIARIGNSQGGALEADRMMNSEGVDAIIDCFEYDTHCEITGYTMTYVAKNTDPIETINQSGKHNEKTLELVQNAKVGDIYYFDNVLCQCPGDLSTRPINSMVFKIR